MQMSETGLTLGQFVITLRAESHNPTILNPDFLKHEGIVPSDWELAEEPVCVRHFARVAYKNRVTVVAEFDNLIFSEEVWSREQEAWSIASIAARYIETLPHVDYRAVVNKFVGDLVVQKKLIDHFIRVQFIREGPWAIFNDAKARARVAFQYKMKGGSFVLAVQEARRPVADGKPLPVILFDGEFTRLTADRPAVGQAVSFINLWKPDLRAYISFVEEIIRQ
ncbi:MAG: hypothetical protein FJ118_19820 [Deltaproteobacteria bacterium]|nr:hypothetical protein [Deltaproteobacteria bacterium]